METSRFIKLRLNRLDFAQETNSSVMTEYVSKFSGDTVQRVRRKGSSSTTYGANLACRLTALSHLVRTPSRIGITVREFEAPGEFFEDRFPGLVGPHLSSPVAGQRVSTISRCRSHTSQNSGVQSTKLRRITTCYRSEPLPALFTVWTWNFYFPFKHNRMT